MTKILRNNMNNCEGIAFSKYHGLGNDYMVVSQAALAVYRDQDAVVQRLCDRHFGPGADGILVDMDVGSHEMAHVRIINPDGSEAEKSGNGLRIFARYLWDTARVGTAPFSVRTLGGIVVATVQDSGAMVDVEMGRAAFDAEQIPVLGYTGEVLERRLTALGESVTFSAVTVGNPHCVIIGEADAALACRLGPVLEAHEAFPNRTNVQFVQVVDEARLRIEIWERGAGYTLASGSSSCAAASVAHRLGLVGPKVTVSMPGGDLQIEISRKFELRMRGPVVKVVDGVVAAEALI
ncbi:MAG: diaminopimelate epimerase [Gammaproteobacteria bacterium]|jgi:diaminopimelate epimerase